MNAKDAAVHKQRLYHGSHGVCNVKTQQKLMERANRAIASLAKSTGYDVNLVYEAVVNRAIALGPITPMPGKDY